MLQKLRKLSTLQMSFGACAWTLALSLILSFLPRISIIHGQTTVSESFYSGLTFVERLAHLFHHWDSYKYLDIARMGHHNASDLTPFFPLYPWLLKIFAWVPLEWNILWACLVSTLSFVGAILIWDRIFKQLNFSDGRLLVAFYPTTVFFFSPYPDSLYIFLFSICVDALMQQRTHYFLLSIVPLLATKHAAIPLSCAMMLWSFLNFPKKEFFKVLFAWIIGLILILGYYQLQFNDPMAWLKAQQNWGRKASLPWHYIGDLYGKSVDLGLYLVWSFVAPCYLFFRYIKSSGAQRSTWLLMFLCSAAVLVPLWFGSSTQSLYRIMILVTPSLLVFSRVRFFKTVFWIFLLLNIYSTYRYVGGSHIP